MEEDTPTDPLPLDVVTLRRFFVAAIGGYSEERYSAGWLAGIEDEVRRLGGPWTLLAVLCHGWPVLSERPRRSQEVPGDGPDSYVSWFDLMDWEPVSQAEHRMVIDFLYKRIRNNPSDRRTV